MGLTVAMCGLHILSAALLTVAVARADWPCWRGAFGSGAARDCGQPLVQTLADARLVWLSEARTYQSVPRASQGSRPYLYTGQAGPVVAGGRVFLYYPLPDGRQSDWKAEEKFAGYEFDPATLGMESRQQVAARYHSITAEDVVLCADARTGGTLWQRNLPGAMNQTGRAGAWFWSKEGSLLTPCVADGKVFLVGNTYRVLALDLETGETVWESTLGPAADAIECVRDEGIMEGDASLKVNTWAGSHAPAFADGVLCCDDESGTGPKGPLNGGGLVAFDGETGEELWRLPAGANRWPGPIRWCGLGREYFLSGRGALIEPRTGTVLWGPFEKRKLVTAGRQYMILEVAGVGWECRRISSRGTSLAWTRTGEEMNSEYDVPVIGGGHVIWTAGRRFHCLDLASGKKHSSAGGIVRERGRTRGGLIYSDGVVVQESCDIVRLSRYGRIAGGKPMEGAIPGHPGLVPAAMTTGAIADGCWYVRLLDSLACFQLRRALHEKVLRAESDPGRLIALCGDADPAVCVDAVVALRRGGDMSAAAVKALVACLDRVRLGAAREAARALRALDVPPEEVVRRACEGAPERRRLALDAVGDWEALPVAALVWAASDPLYARAPEAAVRLERRCRDDLAPVVERITTARSAAACRRLQEVVDANLRSETLEGVLNVLRTGLPDADRGAAVGLIESLAGTGLDAAWGFLEAIVTDREHRLRGPVLDALAGWPGERPVETLGRIHADAGEGIAIRAAAFRAALPMHVRLADRAPAGERLARMEALFDAAEELGQSALMLRHTGRIPNSRALCLVAGLLSDRELREEARSVLNTIVTERLKPGDLALSPETLAMLAAVTDEALRAGIVENLRRGRGRLDDQGRRAIGSMIRQAAPRRAARLLEALCALGTDEAWGRVQAVVAERTHPHRLRALDALRHWPGEEPRELVEGILADRSGESNAVRAAALRTALVFAGRRAAALPAARRPDLLEPLAPAAGELGVMPELLWSLGRTGSLRAVERIGTYIDDETLGDQALAALEVCAERMPRADIAAAARRFDALAKQSGNTGRRRRLAVLAGKMRKKDKNLAPTLDQALDGLDTGQSGFGLPEGL